MLKTISKRTVFLKGLNIQTTVCVKKDFIIIKSFCSLTRLPVPFGLLHHRQRVVPRLSLRVPAEATDQPYMQPTAVPTDPQVNHRRVTLVKCDTEVNALKTKAARFHFCSPESKWGFFFLLTAVGVSRLFERMAYLYPPKLWRSSERPRAYVFR